jgi:hypothetical protein
VQRPVEIPPVGNSDHPDRSDRIDDFAGANRQPGGAQGAREVHQIGDKTAVVMCGHRFALPGFLRRSAPRNEHLH